MKCSFQGGGAGRDLLPWIVPNDHHVILTVGVQDSPSFVRITQQAFHSKELLQLDEQVFVAVESREINSPSNQASLFVNLHEHIRYQIQSLKVEGSLVNEKPNSLQGPPVPLKGSLFSSLKRVSGVANLEGFSRGICSLDNHSCVETSPDSGQLDRSHYKGSQRANFLTLQDLWKPIRFQKACVHGWSWRLSLEKFTEFSLFNTSWHKIPTRHSLLFKLRVAVNLSIERRY
nr:hypothetical protein Iba_chr12dCG18960 [Ipomoea batatas]